MVKLTPEECPCGCKKIILEPLCGCRCSSVSVTEAREVTAKVNYFDEVLAALNGLLDGTTTREQAGEARDRAAKALRSRRPFPKSRFSDNG